jgi:hypothetical protein
MSASSIMPWGGFVEPTEDLSSDPMTIAMLRFYRRASPARQRAFARMLERVAEEGMPTEEAGRLYGIELGLTDAHAREVVATAISAPPGSWRRRMLD